MFSADYGGELGFVRVAERGSYLEADEARAAELASPATAGCVTRHLEAVFEAREIGRSTAPDGRIANCQVRFAATTIMVSEASRQFPATRAAHYLYVEDADAAMVRAERAGARRIMDVDDMPYGDRQGGVLDPAGNIWWVSQRMNGEPYF